MLYLLLKAGGQTYALEAARIREILPLVDLRPVPHAPETVCGLLNYRGETVPVLDFSRLCRGPACARRMSTRIILMPWSGANNQHRLLGLMAESVTATMEQQGADFSKPGLTVPKTPFLGKLACRDGNLVQQVHLDNLVPADLEPLLFAAMEKGS